MSQIDKGTTVFDIFVYTYMVWVLMDGMPYFASQITVTTSPKWHMQLSATSLYGWRRRDNLRTADRPVF